MSDKGKSKAKAFKQKKRRGVKTVKQNVTLWDGTVCRFRSTVYMGNDHKKGYKDTDYDESED